MSTLSSSIDTQNAASDPINRVSDRRFEMNSADTEIADEPQAQYPKSDEASDYGITTSEITYYHYGTYRYTNLKDAIAEAKRDKAKLVDG